MPHLRTPDNSKPSSLCFGCMQFGGTADLSESRKLFEASREAGINFFDTAHTYTGGLSETYLGKFIQGERERLMIATKTGYSGGSGRTNILQQFDESRHRLELDTIDILYLHRWDPDTPLEETFEALSQLQQDGKVRHVGVSNFAAWQVMKAQHVATKLGTRIDFLQPMYSLVKRQAEVELFPMALSEGIAVVPYSPLGGGLLTGKYLAGATGRLSTDERYAARYGQAWMTETARGFSEMGKDIGVDPATLAVSWAAQHPAVMAPIISARNVEQLQPSLAAASFDMDTDLYSNIEMLSQRPAPATDRLEEALS